MLKGGVGGALGADSIQLFFLLWPSTHAGQGFVWRWR
jgi:hypothetical protein